MLWNQLGSPTNSVSHSGTVYISCLMPPGRLWSTRFWTRNHRVPFLALPNVKSQALVSLPWNTEFQLLFYYHRCITRDDKSKTRTPKLLQQALKNNAPELSGESQLSGASGQSTLAKSFLTGTFCFTRSVGCVKLCACMTAPSRRKVLLRLHYIYTGLGYRKCKN